MRTFSLVSIFSSQTTMRQKMPRSKTLTGIVLAVAAGCFWGTMAVSGQYMITACGFNAEELTTVRIAGAGILMLVLGMLTEKIFSDLSEIYPFAEMCVSTDFVCLSSNTHSFWQFMPVMQERRPSWSASVRSSSFFGIFL